jgi:hypothetical protein
VRSLRTQSNAFEMTYSPNPKNFPATVERPRNIQLYEGLYTEDGCGRNGS